METFDGAQLLNKQYVIRAGGFVLWQLDVTCGNMHSVLELLGFVRKHRVSFKVERHRKCLRKF